MLFRYATLLALGFALGLAGCSDDATRSTAPPDRLVLENLTQDVMTHWINALVKSSDEKADAHNLFNDIKDAADRQAAANLLRAYMLHLYADDFLQVPDPPRTKNGELFCELMAFLHAVAEYYDGVEYDLPSCDSDESPESGLHVVTENDFTDDDALVCFPTEFGNAAGCFKKASLFLPAVFTAVFQPNNFPMPPGVEPVGSPVIFHVWGDAIDPAGPGVVASMCTPGVHDHNQDYRLYRWDHVSEFADEKAANSLGHTCTGPEGATSFLNGNSLFARGVNAVGSVLVSIMSPKRAYGTHSLAHSGGLFSHWMVGEVEEAYDVRIVRVIPPATHDEDGTSATFKQSGGFTIWLEIERNGQIVTCSDELVGIADVQARATGTRNTTVRASAWISANRCELVGVTPAFVVEIPNPLNNSISSGVIDVRVRDIAAEPQLKYEATL